jgi:hypothetical protein
MGLQQRGLIYTEHKPLGRLYKMCKLFYRVFRVIPSANGFQLFGLQSTVSTVQCTCSLHAMYKLCPEKTILSITVKMFI